MISVLQFVESGLRVDHRAECVLEHGACHRKALRHEIEVAVSCVHKLGGETQTFVAVVLFDLREITGLIPPVPAIKAFEEIVQSNVMQDHDAWRLAADLPD